MKDKNILNMNDYNLHMIAKPHGMQIAYESETINCITKVLHALISFMGSNMSDDERDLIVEATEFIYKESFRKIFFMTIPTGEFLQAKGFTTSNIITTLKEEALANGILDIKDLCMGYVHGVASFRFLELGRWGYLINPTSADDVELLDNYTGYMEYLKSIICEAIDNSEMKPVDSGAVWYMASAIANVTSIIRIALCAYSEAIYENKLAKIEETIPHVKNLFQLLLNDILSSFKFIDDNIRYIQLNIELVVCEDEAKGDKYINMDIVNADIC